jgi:phosphatidylinositol 3-kinase
MQKWSLIDVDDALELLSKQFTNVDVRKYAVSRLREANDEVILNNSLLPSFSYVDHQITLR